MNPARTLRVLLLVFSAAVRFASGAADPATHRYLYMSSPDGAQAEGASGAGILVFDIDAEHRFVRRIDVPSFREGLRGFTPSLRNHQAYFSTTSRRLGCIDLESDRVLWEKTYAAGCDRSSVSEDGTKVYVPTGWWYAAEDSGFLVVNAADGRLLERLKVGPKAHNSLVSLDGRYAWCHTPEIYDARTKERVGLLKDQDGQLFASSKFFEVHFRQGKVVRVGNEFGLGRAPRD